MMSDTTGASALKTEDDEEKKGPEKPADAPQSPDDAKVGAEGQDAPEKPADGQSDAKEDDTKESTKEEFTNLPPEVMFSELTRARSEAANYRTQLREAQKALEGAKTLAEFEAATRDLQDKNVELERQVLLFKYGKGLPEEALALLTGKDEDEIKTQAATLSRLFASSVERDPEEADGGLNPGSSKGVRLSDLSPGELARLSKRPNF